MSNEEFKNPAKQYEFNDTVLLILREILSQVSAFIPKEQKQRFDLYLKVLTEMNKGIKYREEKPTGVS